MSSVPLPRYTPEEYLDIERKAEFKHEFHRGEMFAMAGASRAHVVIATNVSGTLLGQLRGKRCTVFSTDLRVKVSPTGLYTYPDVIVACGEEFDDEQEDTLLNPRVLIEVLSDSTETYDRGRKFAHYRTLDSLEDYLLVSQKEPRIEHYARTKDGWLLHEATSLAGKIAIKSIGCELVMSDVYDKVEFDDEQGAADV
jgi:Uma2 family endonuclease